MPQSHTWRIVRVGGRPSVVAQWQSTGRLKPEESWVRLPATAGFFTFLYFRLITSKFISSMRQGALSKLKHFRREGVYLFVGGPKLVNFRFMSVNGVSRMFKI